MKGVKGEQVVFLPGDVIFSEGDESQSLMYIQEGKVEVFREREGTHIVLANMVPGEFLGTVTLFSKEPRTAGAKATTQVKLMVMKASQLEQGLKDIPVWIQAVVKDMVARLKFVDEKLVDARLKEKYLSNKVGTPLHVAAQLCRFIVAQARVGCVEFEKGEVLPMNGLLPMAASVFLKQLEPIAEVYNILTKQNIVREVQTGNLGPCFAKGRTPLLEEFSAFALATAKNGDDDFAPSKLLPYISALSKLKGKLPEAEAWPRATVLELLGKEMGRELPEDVVVELSECGALKLVPGDNLGFSPVALEKRVMFESAARLIMDLDDRD